MSESIKRPEPKRVLQLFDPIAQKVYRHWTAKDRLEWLGNTLKLYWSAMLHAEAMTDQIRDKKNDD